MLANLVVGLLCCAVISQAQLSPAPAPSRTPKPACTLILPSALPDTADASSEGAARAAADAKLSFANAQKNALNAQLTCLMAYETDLSTNIDQLQGVLVPDATTQVQQAQSQLTALASDRNGAASLRKAREAETAVLKRRLDALLARAEMARKEQMKLIDAAAAGGLTARSEAERQARLVKENRALVQRVEVLRSRRDSEKVRRCGGVGVLAGITHQPGMCSSRSLTLRRRRRAHAQPSHPTARQPRRKRMRSRCGSARRRKMLWP